MTPKSVILDLLRVASGQPAVPVSDLLALGALFGFSDNAIRVAVTRLVGSGLLVSHERGSYALAPRTDPVNRLVDEWRLGEARMRAWKGRWLAVWHPTGTARGQRQRSRRAMEMLGFRPGLDGLWVRPDNLARRRPALSQRLRDLGLSEDAELIVADGFSGRVTERWCGELWPATELQAGYRTALRAIERSTERAHRTRPDKLMVETFLVGGAAIRTLALDPLLPADICPGDTRRALCEAMLAYDQLGRNRWATILGEAPLVAAPTHTSIQGAPSDA